MTRMELLKMAWEIEKLGLAETSDLEATDNAREPVWESNITVIMPQGLRVIELPDHCVQHQAEGRQMIVVACGDLLW